MKTLEGTTVRGKFLTPISVVCLSILFTCSVAFGQSVYGEISGTFTDNASGVPIRGAKVSITSLEKGTKFRTTTNQSGNFSVPDLVPDTYVLIVEADGFKTYKDSAIPVSADQPSRIDVKMVKGPAAELMTAIGEVSILKTDHTDVSTMFTSKALDNLPVRDLNVSSFEQLVPGVLPTTIRLSTVQNPQAGNTFSVNGQHFSGTAFQLDGTDNRDPLEGLIVINPTLESVNEMKVTTQNYSAEFGEATAGVVTIQTHSGTNVWHGSAFEYRRTSWLQANNPFAPAGVAPTRRNEFGGSLGGPLVKNKLFFFSDYQGQRDNLGDKIVLDVPTALVRSTCLTGTSTVCDLSEYPRRIYDPTTQNLFGPSGNCTSNCIPEKRVAPAAIALLSLLPPPTSAGFAQNFQATGADNFNADQFNLRTDYNPTGTLKLFGRYSFADFREDAPAVFGPVAGGPGANQRAFAGIGRTLNQSVSLGFAYSFSPSLLADFRFGFFRYHLNLDSPDLGTQPALNIANITGLNNDLFSSGMPDFELPASSQTELQALGSDYLRFGYSPQVNSCNCPLREREQQFQWVSNWLKSAGNHAFKWGADVRYLQNYRLSSERRRAGHLSFNPSDTAGNNPGSGLALATFLLGDVIGFDRYYANPNNPASLSAGERQKRSFFYGQDTWRVSSRLTLNYGLRWEIYFPQVVTGNGAGGFLIPNFSSPFNSVFRVPGIAGIDNQGNVKNSFTNLGPRIGIAYLAGPKTVIRAGYGRSFDVGFGGSIFGIAATQNPPVMAFQSANSVLTNSVFSLLPQAPATTVAAPSFSFPSAPFSINNLYQSNLSPQSTQLADQALTYALPDRMRLPTVDAWNFTVQHELSSTLYFEIGYVGNKGTHVFTDAVDGTPYYDLNQASLNGYVISGNSTNNPGACKAQQPNGNFCISKTITRRLFDPWPASVEYFGNNASDNYNSLQIKVNKRFRQGYELLAHYTFAKALDYDSNYFNINPRVGYGPSNFDRRHSFVLASLWSLPLGRGKALLGGISPAADRIIGGWAISTITTSYSGLPFTPTYNNTNCGADQSGAGAPCRPNLVGFAGITGSRNGYFTTTGGIPLPASTLNGFSNGFDSTNGTTSVGGTAGPWQRPAPGTIGDIGRNSFHGPDFFQNDLAVSKDIAFTERVFLRFRADALNAFNKVNLGIPATCVDCSNGGVINGLAGGAIQRQMQFSLKLQF